MKKPLRILILGDTGFTGPRESEVLAAWHKAHGRAIREKARLDARRMGGEGFEPPTLSV